MGKSLLAITNFVPDGSRTELADASTSGWLCFRKASNWMETISAMSKVWI
jgi:hypothetical protein